MGFSYVYLPASDAIEAADVALLSPVYFFITWWPNDAVFFFFFLFPLSARLIHQDRGLVVSTISRSSLGV